MNITLLLDKRIAERGSLLRPHYGIHDINNPGRLDGTQALPDVTSAVLSNFINY